MKISEKIVELSNKELIAMAPSVGQTKPLLASDKYSFISTLKTVDWLRDAGWKPVMAQQSKVRDESKEGFQKHMIRFTRPDLVMNNMRMDYLLFNAHDSGSLFKSMLGPFSFVCSNGLICGEKLGQFTHRHLGFDIDKFVTNAQEMIKIGEGIGAVVEDWQSIELTPNERGIFTQAATKCLYNDLQTFDPAQLLEIRRKEDSAPTLWKTYNVIQENIIKGGLKGKSEKGRSTVTREIVSIDRDREINQTLWKITKNLEEYKNAA